MQENRSFSCPLCGSERLVTTEEGGVLCGSCGYVINLSGLANYARLSIGEANSGRLSEEGRRIQSMLRSASRRDASEDRLLKLRAAIEQLSRDVAVNEDIKEKAAQIGLRLIENVRKRISIYLIAAYALLLASREEEKPISLDDLKGALRIFETENRMRRFIRVTKLFEKYYKIRCKININKYVDATLTRVLSHRDVRERAKRFGGPIAVKAELRRRTSEVLRRIPRSWILGKKPFSSAAAIVYVAEAELARESDRRKLFSQRELAESVNQSEYTIRERVSDLYRLGVAKPFRRARS